VLNETNGLPSIYNVVLVCVLQVLLLKHLIDYLAEDKDEELKEFVEDFLNPNSSVSWLFFFSSRREVFAPVVEARQ